MSENPSPLAAFHLTGERSGNDLDGVAELGLRPALFSAYQDLSKLRYDYPVVLVNGDAGGAFVQSLSGIVDGILQEIAPRGIEGERLRKHVLGLEQEIRTLASRGSKGSLLQLWDLAETNLLSGADDAARESLNDSLGRARSTLRFDGEVTDCDGELPVELLTRAWTMVQRDKARKFHDKVDELVLKLSDILKAAAMTSEEAQGAEALKRSFGPEYEAEFDFEAMSGILRAASADRSLPMRRRRRIGSALLALKSQRFFAPAGERVKKGRREASHTFVFDHCAPALQAFQDRLPEMIELVKAMTIAQLEIENRYNEATHDPFFSRFDERFLGPEDMALFPSYLVCLRDGVDAAAEKAKLIETLSSGLPIKVLVQSNDILEESSFGSGQLSFGIRGAQLAAMAMGLNNAYVLQSSSSCLYQLRDAILRGLANHGPALFSVYSGLAGDSSSVARNASDTPPYLRAAAATESRAFPTFTYDPASGSDWASRFCLGVNPQAESEWPIHHLSYEDEDLQRISKDVAFTFVDFVACDGRYAGHFARVPGAEWHDSLVPVNEFLELDTEGAAEKIPYILMVDEGDSLHGAVVEDRLIQAAHRCRQMWRSLQELAGINNSHATKLLAREREIWEQEKEREFEELTGRPANVGETPAGAEKAVTREEAAEADIEQPEEAPSDEPYIETPRCTTCNECTEINGKMFVYDENMQAYIADPDAGTYRQLVEAAEVCQVCIIHPGKPKNPNEPKLDELIARAEPFM